MHKTSNVFLYLPRQVLCLPLFTAKMNDDAKYFSYPLGEQQAAAFSALKRFVQSEKSKVFLLKGYAGTGKTSLVGGLMRWMKKQELGCVMLATTGRAAKVLSDKCGSPASTIHRQIYVFKDLDDDLAAMSNMQQDIAVDDKGQLTLLFSLRVMEPEEPLVYVVDESSMISDELDKAPSFARFGDGRLLHDLFTYDLNGKFIFLGDPCQLPPISQPVSHALSAEYIQQTYSLPVEEFVLTQIQRQTDNNGIVTASYRVRQLWEQNPPVKWAKFPLAGSSDIVFHNTHQELVDAYMLCYHQKTSDYATLICQTNRLCYEINSSIRKHLGRESDYPITGDLLLVTQNNYPTGLVNGDIVEVLAKGVVEYRAGLSFVPVFIKEIATGKEHNVLLMQDIAISRQTNLTNKQHKDLFIDFYQRMKRKGIDQKDARFKEKMFSDPYLNGLRCVYGYALTCHKGQGGEWEEVFLYLDNKIQGLPRPGIYQWIYTAVTRARTRLHVVRDWFIT